MTSRSLVPIFLSLFSPVPNSINFSSINILQSVISNCTTTISIKMLSKKPSMKKKNSFPLKTRSSPNSYYSMDHQQIRSTIGGRSSRKSGHYHHQVEFPISPEVPQLGDEIFNETLHPQHPISQTNLPDLFTCAACKEYGAGERFGCTDCDYQLHDFCALAPPVLKRHPIHPLHKIIFSSKPGKYFLVFFYLVRTSMLLP